MKLGVHVSAAGGVDRVPERAFELGCEALQLFVKSNRQWAMRPLRPDEAKGFRDGLAHAPDMPAFAHACYLVNLASADPAVRERSVANLVAELDRCGELGLHGLVVHPGAHGGDRERGLERALRAIDRVLDRSASPTRLLLESTAGQGSCIGADLADLAWLLGRTPPERVGACLDTCHLHAAGYRLDGAPAVGRALDAVGEQIGWQRVKLWHLNDSRAPAGSRRDRHAGIGEGTIGRAGFRALLADARVRSRPGILETPKGESDRLDRLNLARLRALLHRRRWPEDEREPAPSREAR